MRQLFTLATLCAVMSCFAQKRPAEIGLISDNDLYVSTVSDKYYTAGFEFFYRYLNSGTTEETKKITDFRIGQYLFNPRTRHATDPARIDRPFAGYLFAEGGKGYFRENSVVKWNVQAGIVGPDSFAEETQKAIHFLFGYKRVYGWEHQVHNAVAAQAGGFYARSLLDNGKVDLNLQAEGYVGTVLSGGRVGFLSRIRLKGPLVSLKDSNLYDGALSANPDSRKAQKEFYFYFSPNLKYQAHDATIEGSLFDDDSPVVYDVKTFLFAGEAGFKYRNDRWNLSYSFLYHTKEVKDSPNNMGHYYGSIVISKFLD